MFLITQLIGLAVISFYNSPNQELPYGMEPPEEIQEQPLVKSFSSVLLMFAIAIIFFFLLTKLKAEMFIRIWFYLVTVLALGLSLTVILSKLNIIPKASLVAIIIALPLAFFKIFKRNILVHNLTELLIYPGIGAVFVFFLDNLFGSKVILGIILILLAISIYDMWAVWRSEVMQKMAKYQINNLKIFTGFFIPYASKKQRAKIKTLKQKYANKSEKVMEKQFKKAKIKVNLAILGGGDVIFPIITAGIYYRVFGLIPALVISLSATLALLGLFMAARKGKFYPAMPFITTGIYLGMIINWLIF